MGYNAAYINGYALMTSIVSKAIKWLFSLNKNYARGTGSKRENNAHNTASLPMLSSKFTANHITKILC